MLAGAAELIGEGLDYTPWKWWKAGKLQKDRLFLELIVALHFNMSSLLVRCFDPQGSKEITVRTATGQMQINNETHVLNACTEKNIPAVLRDITYWFLGNNINLGMALLLNLLHVLGYSGDDIFKSYIGKNVLNTFRQANGYKEGKYIKIWDTNPEDLQEDNDFLQKYLASSPVAPEEIFDAAYNYLTVRYQKVLENEVL
jgi:dimeric dUTPase (all-alpha-NTP-PPase superfamily)